jgi:nucleotide-binding universal stress UspA family protein
MCFLVAIDLSAPSRSAIELSALLTRATGLSPLLLHVSKGKPPLRQLADLYALAEPLRALDTAPRLRTAQGDPAEQVCAYAAMHGARFIVMGTRGHHDRSANATGSVARRVMTCSEVPVIAVRPQTLALPQEHDLPRGQPVALMDTAGPADAASAIARFIVQATQGRLFTVPSGSAWRQGLGREHAPYEAPAHLVLSIDPTAPTPAWVDHLLHVEPTPMVLVSQHPMVWAVRDHTAHG